MSLSFSKEIDNDKGVRSVIVEVNLKYQLIRGKGQSLVEEL